jgi:hypothetical protein
MGPLVAPCSKTIELPHDYLGLTRGQVELACLLSLHMICALASLGKEYKMTTDAD